MTSDVTAASPAGRTQATDAATRAGGLLTGLAILAVIGTILALVLVQRIGTTYRDGLEVARDGANVAALGAASAHDLAADVADLARTAADGLDQAQALVLLASKSTADVGKALGTNLAAGVEGTANIASGMAGFIEAIERLIPGNSQSLAEDLRALSDGLKPVPDQLKALGDQLIATSEELQSSTAALRAVEAKLILLARSIDEAQSTLAEVDALAQNVALRST
jgi:hypothetical protein